MSKCQTTSGPYTCEREEGHHGECKSRAPEYDSKIEYNRLLRSLVGKNQEIAELKRIESAARELLNHEPASDKYIEYKWHLMQALKERK